MLRTSVLVAGVMGAMGGSAGAGIVTYGAEVFTTGLVPDDNRSDAAPATGPSASPYVASLPTFATSSLTWEASSWLHSGSATGGGGTFASSTASATFTFAADMLVSGSWDFRGIYGTSTDVGWLIADALGNEVFAIQYFGTSTPNTAGGVAAAQSGTFSGVLSAGTYVVSTFAENGDGGGAFESAMTFTVVPMPGTLSVVALASLLARRGRRR
jgi:hypothetical protein